MNTDQLNQAQDQNLSLKQAANFNEFFTAHHLVVFRFIFGMHGGPVEAVEDLTAETFSKAWKSRRSFTGNERAALGWVLRIARNLVIDTQRKLRSRGTEIDLTQCVLPDNAKTPEEMALLNESIQTLWSLLETIPDRQREILILRYMLGWRVNEIARHLGTTENNISVTIRRALARMRTAWPGD